MNRALAETLSFLNGLIAVVIVIATAVAGYRLFYGFAGALVGGAAGFVVAALACGTIAYLALIERHLAKLAGADMDEIGRANRREPSL